MWRFSNGDNSSQGNNENKIMNANSIPKYNTQHKLHHIKCPNWHQTNGHLKYPVTKGLPSTEREHTDTHEPSTFTIYYKCLLNRIISSEKYPIDRQSIDTGKADNHKSPACVTSTPEHTDIDTSHCLEQLSAVSNGWSSDPWNQNYPSASPTNKHLLCSEGFP